MVPIFVQLLMCGECGRIAPASYFARSGHCLPCAARAAARKAAKAAAWVEGVWA